MTAPATPTFEPPPRGTVLRLAWYTVPVHVAIPLGLWQLGSDADGLFTIGFLVIHVGFPFVLAVTYPWWQGRGGEMVALIAIDHLVTFAVFGLLLGLGG